MSSQRPGEQGPTEAVAGDDIRNPLTHLTEPSDPPDFSDPMALFNTLGDYLSPTWWINQVLNDTIGVNPMEQVNQLVVGDWKGFARCGIMWAQLAAAADDIGDNLDNGLRWLAADWQGKAGDAAVYYFDYVGKAVHSPADVFRVLHDKYVDIARDVWLCSKTLADIIKAIMDAAFVAGLAVLAAASLSWTGIGAGISWSVAAWQCSQILKLWGDASSAIATIQTLITGFVGMATSPDEITLREITPLPMPVVEYDHLGVAPRTGPTPTEGRTVSSRPFDPLADLSLSPAHKAAARKQLDLLAEQTRHPELRDLARDVLSGRVNLRGALVDPRATAVLDEQVGRFSTWYHELSADERAEHERRAEQFAEDANREAAAPAGPHSRSRPDNEDEWEEPRPILRKRRR